MDQPQFLFFPYLHHLLRHCEFLAFAAADADAYDLACRCGDALAVVLELGDAFVVFSAAPRKSPTRFSKIP